MENVDNKMVVDVDINIDKAKRKLKRLRKQVKKTKKEVKELIELLNQVEGYDLD